MEGLVAGDVVVVSFPFSDLSATKRRPALVVATPSGDDLILAQITSRSVRDGYAVDVANDNFHTGTLKRPSNARPNKLFTADKSIPIHRRARHGGACADSQLGGMLSREGRQYMEMAPRLALWPGVCLTIVVYSLNMFGDAVRDLLDPRLRGATQLRGGGGRLGA